MSKGHPRSAAQPTYTRKKPCTGCGKPFSPDDWYSYSGANGKRYWNSFCIACMQAKVKRWAQTNREQYNALQRASYQRLKKAKLQARLENITR